MYQQSIELIVFEAFGADRSVSVCVVCCAVGIGFWPAVRIVIARSGSANGSNQTNHTPAVGSDLSAQ